MATVGVKWLIKRNFEMIAVHYSYCNWQRGLLFPSAARDTLAIAEFLEEKLLLLCSRCRRFIDV